MSYPVFHDNVTKLLTKLPSGPTGVVGHHQVRVFTFATGIDFHARVRVSFAIDCKFLEYVE
jgi:hypothetical protein